MEIVGHRIVRVLLADLHVGQAQLDAAVRRNQIVLLEISDAQLTGAVEPAHNADDVQRSDWRR